MYSDKDLFGENIEAILNIGGKKAKERPRNIIDDRVRQRSQKQLLRVTFPDGKVFCKNSVTLTFTETLRYIGAERVASVGLLWGHGPLLMQEVPAKIKDACKLLDEGWYVNLLGSDTSNKYRQLIAINEALELSLRIDIGTDLETDGTKGFSKTSRTSQSMLVKFEDGTYIGEPSVLSTYVETIKRIGVDVLQRKGLELGGKPLITASNLYNGQVEISKFQWLTVPGQTKDKVKWLKMIATMMHIKLEVTLI